MIRQSYLACTAGLLLAIAACDSSTGPSAGITQTDANKLAADIDGVSTLGTGDLGLGASFSLVVPPGGVSATVTTAPTTFNNTFDVTRQCPKGGSVEFAGSITGTGDRTTHSLTVDATATRTDTKCAFAARNGATIEVTGNPNIAYKGHLNIVNGLPVGLQTQSHEGSFKWVRGTESGTCDIKVSSSYDPTTHTLTVTGTVCGRDVSVTRTRG
jgi:phage baseplate assembly protein gpV